MKKTICLILLIVCTFGLFSCTEDNNEVPSNYPKDAESNLTDEDYVDHFTTYDGHKLSYDKSKWYVNDLTQVPLPDPHVYEEDGVYYIVGTTDSDTTTIDCYTTTDFKTYKRHKAIYDSKLYNYPAIDDAEDCWENNVKPQIYAPEMYKFGDKYYLYYSAFDEDTSKHASGVRRNSVVVADNPLGPYTHVKEGEIDGFNKYVFEDKNKNYHVLDVTMFTDDDGSMYMYYAVARTVSMSGSSESQHIVGVKMNSPIEADWSTYKVVIRPGFKTSSSLDELPNPYYTLEWEMYRTNASIAEAPYMIKSNGKYYMTYSVNGCWNKYYNVCYAVSDKPLEGFEKPFTMEDYQNGNQWTNLLIGYPGTNVSSSDVFNQWTGFASGTAHHCFFKIGDQVMIGYHAHQNRNHNNELKWCPRIFAFDYVHFDSNGTPFVNGPTYSVNPLPEAISGYKNIAANATVKFENVENANAVNDNYIVDCYNLSQEIGKEVVIGKGYAYIELEFDQEYEIGGIAIYNSAYYDKYVPEIKYIDFGNGNVIQYATFATDVYVNEDTEFVFPNSAITVDITSSFKSNKVVLCFNLDFISQINEIVILGK